MYGVLADTKVWFTDEDFEWIFQVHARLHYEKTGTIHGAKVIQYSSHQDEYIFHDFITCTLIHID